MSASSGDSHDLESPGPRKMQKSYVALPGRNHWFTFLILTKFSTSYLYLEKFWKVLSLFKILKFRGSYKDKEDDQNNLG